VEDKSLKKRGLLIFCMLFIMLLSIPAYAETNEEFVEKDALRWSEVELATESDATHSSSYRQASRGLVIAAGIVQISNEGKGVLGVYAETLSHTYADEIAMTIYLDVMESEPDSDEEDWHTVNYYTYSWTKEDAPNEELNAVSVSFDIHGLERGRYYRLRGAHYVYSGDYFEGRTSRTAFIPLN